MEHGSWLIIVAIVGAVLLPLVLLGGGAFVLIRRQMAALAWRTRVAQRSPTLVKTYRGSRSAVTKRLQADTTMMAAEGYVPSAQSWGPGEWGTEAFVLAILFSFVLIGVLALIYMLIVKPEVTLTVTYERKAAVGEGTYPIAMNTMISMHARMFVAAVGLSLSGLLEVLPETPRKRLLQLLVLSIFAALYFNADVLLRKFQKWRSSPNQDPMGGSLALRHAQGRGPNHYDVWDKGRVIGNIVRLDEPAETWFWGIQISPTRYDRSGKVASLEEAKTQFLREYGRWVRNRPDESDPTAAQLVRGGDSSEISNKTLQRVVWGSRIASAIVVTAVVVTSFVLAARINR